jgi:cytosine/adenosine deaminase-related metal-dependent hydrolase
MPTTLIKGAELVVAWDASEKRHAYMPDADVGLRGRHDPLRRPPLRGVADTTVDGAGLMVMPGLVNIHSTPPASR